MASSPELNSNISVKGSITLEKYLRGKTLLQLEEMLGFHSGRFRQGISVAALQRLPLKHEFILQGYNQVANHKFDKRSLNALHIPTLKEILTRDVWKLYGPNRLIKVIPVTPHDENTHSDVQYPAGWGIPQWIIIDPFTIEALVIATLRGYPTSRFL